MKIVTTEMDAHLAQDVTTLATCWKVTRTDGVVLGFTDHDLDLIIDGVTFIASSGYFRSAIANSATTAVDNLEVNGFLDDQLISEADLRNGAYDYATVEIFAVNWADLTIGIVRLRYGLFGEVNFYPSGLFIVELRGLTQLYAQTIGFVYQPECRRDLGDEWCKFKLLPDLRVSVNDYAIGDRVLIPLDATQVKVSIPIQNASFESGDTYVTDWSSSGACYRRGANLNLSPEDGNYYLLPAGGDTTNNVPIPLVISPVTTSEIDAGLYNIEVDCQTACENFGWSSNVTIQFLDASDAHIVGTDLTTGMLENRPERMWIARTLVGDVPVGARSFNIILSYDHVAEQQASANKAVFDNLSAFLTKKTFTADDLRNYNGVEFECTVAGVTDAAVPDVTGATIGSTITDGTATWECKAPKYSFLGTVNIVIDNTTFSVTGIDVVDDWFEFGVIYFYDGPNAGRAMEIKSWNNTTKMPVTLLPLMYTPEPGNKFKITVGCDKSREICFSRFDNILNFRGEPDIPGTDNYFKVGGLGVGSGLDGGGGGTIL